MLKKIAFILIVPTCCLFSNEHSEKNPDEGKPHSSGEVALDVTKGIVYSAGAGVAAARGNIPGAVGGIIAGAESFKRAAEKACENIEYEKNIDNERDYIENDIDSWDRDY